MSIRRRSGVVATVALLTACNSSGSQLALGPSANESNAHAPSTLVNLPSGTVAVPDRNVSWISPEAVNANALLYISDASNYDVYIYTFPALKLAGTLTRFNQPEGECTDKQGDIWIANTGSNQVFEFKHGGKAPIRSLTDPNGRTVSCAVDPTNGDLAVTDFVGLSGAGGVSVYRNATGTPIPYSNPDQYYYYFDGYDADGNLYASGKTSGGTYSLSVLPRGRKSMSTVAIRGGRIYFPGAVQWVGSTLALGDQQCNNQRRSCFYETSVSGLTATIKHVTLLAGSCDVAQAWIEGKQLAGGDYEDCGRGGSRTKIWPYPAAGKALRSAFGVHAPVGATISNK